MLYFLQESVTKIMREIANLFFELFFFEHGYLIYYSRFTHEILSSHAKHS